MKKSMGKPGQQAGGEELAVIAGEQAVFCGLGHGRGPGEMKKSGGPSGPPLLQLCGGSSPSAGERR